MTEKKTKRDKKFSVEELYQNKNFVPPKEKNLETIFEEPRKSKDGAPILTSVRKYRRYLHFDPTEGKIHKRKMKAKKCVNKIKTNKLRTRSSSKISQSEDISLYILETIGDSSDSDMDVTHNETESSSTDQDKITSELEQKRTVELQESTHSSKEICDQSLEDKLQETSDTTKSSLPFESQESTKVESVPGELESDSFSENIESPVEKRSYGSSCIVT